VGAGPLPGQNADRSGVAPERLVGEGIDVIARDAHEVCSRFPAISRAIACEFSSGSCISACTTLACWSLGRFWFNFHLPSSRAISPEGGDLIHQLS
jgi:hypothetical protein